MYLTRCIALRQILPISAAAILLVLSGCDPALSPHSSPISVTVITPEMLARTQTGYTQVFSKLRANEKIAVIPIHALQDSSSNTIDKIDFEIVTKNIIADEGSITTAANHSLATPDSSRPSNPDRAPMKSASPNVKKLLADSKALHLRHLA
jgi:hypothetical protein